MVPCSSPDPACSARLAIATRPSPCFREAVDLGVTHIDTSDFYGPATVNEVIKGALYPYPSDLRIVTKVGALRGEDASWNPALSGQDLIDAVHANLDHLGVDVLAVVNLLVGAHRTPSDESLAEPFSVLAELQQQGLIRHLGSAASPRISSPRHSRSPPS